MIMDALVYLTFRSRVSFLQSAPHLSVPNVQHHAKDGHHKDNCIYISFMNEIDTTIAGHLIFNSSSIVIRDLFPSSTYSNLLKVSKKRADPHDHSMQHLDALNSVDLHHVTDGLCIPDKTQKSRPRRHQEFVVMKHETDDDDIDFPLYASLSKTEILEQNIFNTENPEDKSLSAFWFFTQQLSLRVLKWLTLSRFWHLQLS